MVGLSMVVVAGMGAKAGEIPKLNNEWTTPAGIVSSEMLQTPCLLIEYLVALQQVVAHNCPQAPCS